MTSVDASRVHQPSLVKVGGWPFLITGAIGRIPAATLQLGLLMYVTSSGLGFGLGGLTVAANGLGIAAGAPIVGRAADRFGPAPVVLAAIIGQTLGLLMLIAVVAMTPLPALVLLCSFVVGAANPQVGPISRAHWSLLARKREEPSLIRVALGYEGACDEVSFVVGPVLASLLVGLLGPDPALWVLLCFTWVGEGIFWIFLATRSPQPTASQSAGSEQDGTSVRVPLPLGRMVWPLLGCMAAGMIFGSTQTTLTAVSDAAGRPELSGLIYGCVGIGSACMSILVVRLPASRSMKIICGGALMIVGETMIQFVQSPGIQAAVALGIGIGVGAVLVSSFGGIEQVAPQARVNQAMTMAMTALTLGISLGAAVSGMLVSEPTRGFWPGVAAGALAVTAGCVIGAQSPTRPRRI